MTVAISLLLQDIFLFSGDVASNIRLGNRIDSHTEQTLQRAMNRVMADRTSIIIAHRLSTIKIVNKIVVMHKGTIRETGSHQQLLQQRGLYYKLYQLQYRDQVLRPSEVEYLQYAEGAR